MTAQISGFRTRAQLNLRKPRSVSYNITPQDGGCAVHYGGPTPNPAPKDHTTCEAVWRAWQNYHMDSNGWVDIAYTAGYCNHGYVLAGRGYGVRTAANGTNSANNDYYAFVWVGGGNAIPSQAALDALEWLILDARANGKAGKDVYPHKHFFGTECPGDFLTKEAAKLNAGIPAQPKPTTSTPSKPKPKPQTPVGSPPRFPLPSGHVFGPRSGPGWQHSGYAAYSDSLNLKVWQAQMVRRGWKITVDGKYGDQTANVAYQFQKEKGLVADRLIGIATWNAAWTAKVT